MQAHYASGRLFDYQRPVIRSEIIAKLLTAIIQIGICHVHLTNVFNDVVNGR